MNQYDVRVGLVEDLDYKTVLKQYNHILNNTTIRRFDYDVLGFVTPWNSDTFFMKSFILFS